MPSRTKSKLTILETVYPPISNQEAVWLQDDPEVEEHLRQSDFYMIGGRAEAKFEDIVLDNEARELRFNFVIGDGFSDQVNLRVEELSGVAGSTTETYAIETGEKIIRIWDRSTEAEPKLLEWFTTEKLIWDRSRGRPGIIQFDRYREAATYDLLYVGIAKVGDSFDRLIAQGHSARLQILSNEPQRYPGARVTDEIYLFLFRVQPTVMTTFDPGHHFEEEDFVEVIDHKSIVADAEKAFVSLLKPSYNVVKFNQYPKGADGLYGSEYARYGYVICEPFTFNTAHGRMKGDRDPSTSFITNDADSIFVDGDTVSLYIAGVDYKPTQS